MSERRVPRFEDDTSAELPTWPPRSAPTADCRLPNSVSSQGAYPAQPAASSACSASDGAAFSSDVAALDSPARRETAGAISPAPAKDAPAVASSESAGLLAGLSESVQMLVMMIGAYHRESDTAAIERAVAHYSGTLGIHLLARPMEVPPSVTPCGRATSPPLRGVADGRQVRRPTTDDRLPLEQKGRAPP